MRRQAEPHPVVSSEAEELILVDDDDREIGFDTKAACHDGDGILHRAFSLFVFTPDGRLVLQQRSADKRLWPGYWANTCCSHPRRGETMDEAIHRRLREELGIDCDLEYLFKFGYHARFGELGSERELCWVYVGTSGDRLRPNGNEIAGTRLVTPEELDRDMAADPDRFTPWLKLEWERLTRDFADRLPGGRAPRRRGP